MKHSAGHTQWFKLDNVARIYVAMLGSRSPTAFRISIVNKESVNTEILQKALDAAMKRFPFFSVCLKRGIFWNFLQHIDQAPTIQEDDGHVCTDFSSRGHLFRVLFYGKCISVEFSHVLTDGIGALTFFRSLIAQYYRLSGVEFEFTDDLLHPGQTPNEEEFEDAYERFYSRKIPRFRAPGKAYHPQAPLMEDREVRIINGFCPASALIDQCHRRQVSLTDFLSAHYLWALYQSAGSSQRDIRLMIPVNLRPLYPSKTLRNFFLTVHPQIKPQLGAYTFDEILKAVHHYMQIEVDERFINQQIARNVSLAHNPFIRIVPHFLKMPAQRMMYFYEGSRITSGIFSNLGVVKLPQTIAQNIDEFFLVTSPNNMTKYVVGVVGFNDQVAITFTGLTQSTEIPRLFFTALRKQGIAVRIESNRE